MPPGTASPGDEMKEDAIRRATSTLAETLRAQDSEIAVLSAEPVEWSADSVECRPRADEGEPPVTSGYKVGLKLRGSAFSVHVAGDRAKICDLQPAAPSVRTGGVQPELGGRVDVAKADLAQRLEIALETIEVIEAVAVMWRDSSAGCPRPGMSYLQMLTPGARIRLRAGDKVYHYHGRGKAKPFLCEKPSKEGFMPIAVE